MKLQNIFFALAVFCLSIIVIMTFTIDLYQEKHYNISLSENPDTAQLSVIQNLSTQHLTSLDNTINSTACNTVGGECTGVSGVTGLSDGDLTKTAFSAMSLLRNAPTIFNSILLALFNVVGLEPTVTQAYFIFFSLLILIPIVIMLLNAVVKNPI